MNTQVNNSISGYLPSVKSDGTTPQSNSKPKRITTLRSHDCDDMVCVFQSMCFLFL